MINSNFDPATISGFSKEFMSVDWQSATGTVAAGQSANIDMTLTDDMMYTGIQLLAKGSNFGDTVTLQIVSLTGVLLDGLVVGEGLTLLNQFGTNIGVCDDQQTKVDMVAEFPAKLLGGMTIRVIYTSTGALPVSVIVNHKLCEVLQ